MDKQLSKKMNKKVLTAQILLALAVCGGTALPGSCEAADITTSQTYTDTTATVTDNIDITDGTISVRGLGSSENTVTLTGNVSIQQGTTPDYALGVLAQGSGGSAVLAVNPDGDKTKTVQIKGNLYVKATNGNTGKLTCRLNNAASYLAGSLQEYSGTGHGTQSITLQVNNGATWYVPVGDSAYDCQAGYSFNLDDNLDGGGYVDLYNLTPTKVRTLESGGSTNTTTLALKNVASEANGATFRVATDVANSKSYSRVALTGSSGTNTYTVQVAYDKSGTAVSTNSKSAVVLTTDSTTDTVKTSVYKTTANAGLSTVNYEAGLNGKTIAASEAGLSGANTYYVTSFSATSANNGPAQLMAEAAQSMAAGTMGAWRAENNELMRRMGDLRGHSEKAGGWLRTYGGESEIRSGASTNLNYLGVQGGYDWDHSWHGGRLFTGIAVSHLHGCSSYSAGSGTMDSNLFGIYGSYVGEKGHYADFILKYGHVASDFNASGTGSTFSGSTGRNGLSASFEYGRRQELSGGRFFEPQAELTYSHLNGVDYTMTMDGAAGASVHEDGMNSFVGRIGGIYGVRTKDGNIYLKLGLLHEFSGSSIVDTAYGTYSNRAENSLRETWLEYGVGFNARVAKNAQVYGEFVKTAGADKIINKWMLNAGLRMSF